MLARLFKIFFFTCLWKKRSTGMENLSAGYLKCYLYFFSASTLLKLLDMTPLHISMQHELLLDFPHA